MTTSPLYQWVRARSGDTVRAHQVYSATLDCAETLVSGRCGWVLTIQGILDGDPLAPPTPGGVPVGRVCEDCRRQVEQEREAPWRCPR